MQPFDVWISPEGVEVHSEETAPSSGPTSTSTSTPIPTSTSTSTAFVTTVALSIGNRYDHTDRLQERLVFGWKVEVDGLVVAEGDDLLPVSGSSTSEDFIEEDKVKAPPGASSTARPAAYGVPEAMATARVYTASGGGGGGDSSGKVSGATVTFETPSLLLPGQECWLAVTGRLRGATAWAAAGHVVGHTQLKLNSEKVRVGSSRPIVWCTNQKVLVTSGVSVVFVIGCSHDVRQSVYCGGNNLVYFFTLTHAQMIVLPALLAPPFAVSSCMKIVKCLR